MNLQQRQQFAQQYANNFVETSISEASPHKLIELLYDGAIKNIRLTKVFMEQKNYEKKSEFLNKALSILLNLREGVDLEKGKDVAENLWALYDYCYRQLLTASFKNDATPLDEVLGLVEDLSESWKQMPDTYKKLSKDQLDRLS